jgi:hypothetical protein
LEKKEFGRVKKDSEREIGLEFLALRCLLLMSQNKNKEKGEEREGEGGGGGIS